MDVAGFLSKAFSSCANNNEAVYTRPIYKAIFSSTSSSNAGINVPTTNNHDIITMLLSEHNQHETAEAVT